MTHYILTIAGEGSRWNNHLGVRKHLVPIYGEPNLYRTLRLINANDKDCKIFLGANPAFPLPDFCKHVATIYDGTTYIKGAESDRYFASKEYWNTEGRTVLVWGDVFFTEYAIKIITNPQRDWLRYGRPAGCRYSKRKSWGEEFAISFHPEHHDAILAACKRVEDISKNRKVQLFGAIYMAMLGLSDHAIVTESKSGRKNNYGHMIDIDDLTDDFDYPEDYDEFIVALRELV